MKPYILFVAIILAAIKTHAQNCFNEYDNTVSSLACVDYQAGFEINKTAALYSNPNQPTYTTTDDNNFTKGVDCWYMMDRSGNFFNIHQYGFKSVEGSEIVIAYKIMQKNVKAELAIVVNGQPYFHGIVVLSDNGHNIYKTGSILGQYSYTNSSFILALDENSRLFGYGIGGFIVTLRG